MRTQTFIQGGQGLLRVDSTIVTRLNPCARVGFNGHIVVWVAFNVIISLYDRLLSLLRN